MSKIYLQQGYKKAFTLAEVLITLSIIGIVSTLTIVPLINNYQKTQYVTGLKKVYAELSQTITNISNEYNCNNDLTCTGLFSPSSSDMALGNAVIKHFKTIKNCDTQDYKGCFPSTTSMTFDGSGAVTSRYDATWGGLSGYKFITSDGMSIFVENYLDNCSTTVLKSVLGNMTNICGFFIVDVNGPTKGPNFAGRDTFEYFITNGNGAKVYPYGGMDHNAGGGGTNSWWTNPWTHNPAYCDASANHYGLYCTGRIMEEGWQMNY